jgi:hypothetical protein
MSFGVIQQRARQKEPLWWRPKSLASGRHCLDSRWSRLSSEVHYYRNEEQLLERAESDRTDDSTFLSRGRRTGLESLVLLLVISTGPFWAAAAEATAAALARRPPAVGGNAGRKVRPHGEGGFRQYERNACSHRAVEERKVAIRRYNPAPAGRAKRI